MRWPEERDVTSSTRPTVEANERDVDERALEG
jgi:hypothetical protein